MPRSAGIDPQLASLGTVMERADERLRLATTTKRIWPTGFDVLDETLNGGMRTGNLVLLAGPPGMGKTTMALQMARNSAVAGRSAIYFTYEHDHDSMLERLVAMEIGLLADYDAPGLERIRASFEDYDGAGYGLIERLDWTQYGAPALAMVDSYGSRLHVHRSTGSKTSLDVIAAAIETVKASTGEPPMVVIDYLQKVKITPTPPDEDERVTQITEGLKDLAIDSEAPILSLVAADHSGLEAGKRMRSQDMRGSTALSYEADVLLVLNGKYNVVARHHLMYAANAGDRFQDWVVMSVEKNRMGKDGVNIEFRKRFEQSRFEHHGRHVTEQLTDERMYTE